MTTFIGILQSIKAFVIRETDEDSKRGFVCGLCWTGDSIAVNTRHLAMLTGYSKSSINGFFANLGYTAVPETIDAELIRCFPHLKNNFPELRQWSMRRKLTYTPPPHMSQVASSSVPQVEEEPTKSLWDDDLSFANFVGETIKPPWSDDDSPFGSTTAV
jgi:hypothetical protein